jgi:serine/threonine protein phosphatase PrpC
MRTSLSPDRLEDARLRPCVAAPRPEPAGPPSALSVTTFGLTDKGRQQSTNEDRFLIASPARALWVARERRHVSELGYGEIEGDIFAVADGSGRRVGGRAASAVALETMSSHFVSTLKLVFALGGPKAVGVEMLEQIKDVLRRADSRAREEAPRNAELREMGTSLTMAYRYGSFLYVGHVGDGLCYVLRDGELHRITRDHSTNALDPVTAELKVDVHCLGLLARDVLLLCTDGLGGLASEFEIAAILEASDSPRVASEKLVEHANDLGGLDNITVVVARFDTTADPPERPGFLPPSKRGVS